MPKMINVIRRTVDGIVGFCHWTMTDGLKESECGYKDVGCHPKHCPKCGREITFDKPNAKHDGRRIRRTVDGIVGSLEGGE